MKSIAREALETIFLALVIFVVVQTVLGRSVVKGPSMEPSLFTGEHLFVNKAVYFRIDGATLEKWLPILNREGNGVFYLFHPPQRGEIVVFHPPKNTTSDYIKRVIGLPGETVEIRDGVVYIDGEPLNEPYLKEPPRRDFGPQEVPPGHYFVLGDNRNNSEDSRAWGMVPYQNVIGKAWLTYWPPRLWGLAPNYSMAGDRGR